ncbi:DNA polymerase IV [Inhella sp.]|uniref:DNA polymerase IV n=1 Tax=Inhella sp. TaxID=1921806 RepID=UPI0035B216E5
MVSRWIAHLDMDAFYASVELLRYPELKGLPVVIGGRREHGPRNTAQGRQFARLRDYTGRGVITTATYAARAFGVRSGLGLMKAAQLAPDCVLLPVDFPAYRAMSRRFKAAVAEIAPLIEDRGIDEIYIDLSQHARERQGAGHDPLAGLKEVAQEIKNNVRAATGGLSCSIGLAPNKLLAKMASELDKPDGLSLVRPEDLAGRIWPLPVRAINGVGPKAAASLEALGIEHIGELAAADPAWLVERFGASYGRWLHQAAHGQDERPVVTHSEPVSISRETTFERDLDARRDRHELGRILTELCDQLAADLARKGYATRTVGIKLRFEGFRTVTRDLTLAEPAHGAAALLHGARECLKRVQFDARMRLLGVRAGKLVHANEANHEAR